MHVCKVYLSEKGGVQVIVERICKGLTDQFDFSILSTAKNKADKNLGFARLNNIKSLFTVFSMPIAPAMLFQLRAQMRNHSVVAIHYPFPLADLAIALAPRRNCRIVVHWHSEIVSQRKLSWLVAPFTKMMLKRADAIICSSPALVEHSRILARYRDKCHVIPFGVPPEYVTDDADEVRPSSSDYFVCVARHVPYKGVDVLIRACANLDFHHRLILIGDGPLLSSHKQLAEQLQLSARIEFVTDADDQQVRALLAGSRALILPSILHSEAFALVQTEAMACGRPVINTDLPSGVPWVARDSREAITVQPGSVNELAAAIARFADDSSIDQFGKAARERVNSVFDYDKFLQSTEECYLQAMATGD